MIVKQPDGKYAVWSSICDDCTHVDCSADDILDIFIAKAVREARKDAARSLDHADSRKDGDEHSFVELEQFRRRVHGGAK